MISPAPGSCVISSAMRLDQRSKRPRIAARSFGVSSVVSVANPPSRYFRGLCGPLSLGLDVVVGGFDPTGVDDPA